MMIEFTKLPRGSYRALHNAREADVWQIAGRGWRFNVLDTASGQYLESGTASTLDLACEEALIYLQA